jgi:hypothetical protein
MTTSLPRRGAGGMTISFCAIRSSCRSLASSSYFWMRAFDFA